MGPIEHAVCQIAFKIEKKYQDNEFKDQVLSIASSIHRVETVSYTHLTLPTTPYV